MAAKRGQGQSSGCQDAAGRGRPNEVTVGGDSAAEKGDGSDGDVLPVEVGGRSEAVDEGDYGGAAVLAAEVGRGEGVEGGSCHAEFPSRSVLSASLKKKGGK